MPVRTNLCPHTRPKHVLRPNTSGTLVSPAPPQASKQNTAPLFGNGPSARGRISELSSPLRLVVPAEHDSNPSRLARGGDRAQSDPPASSDRVAPRCRVAGPSPCRFDFCLDWRHRSGRHGSPRPRDGRPVRYVRHPAKLDPPQFTVETWFKRTGNAAARARPAPAAITNFVPLLTTVRRRPRARMSTPTGSLASIPRQRDRRRLREAHRRPSRPDYRSEPSDQRRNRHHQQRVASCRRHLRRHDLGPLSRRPPRGTSVTPGLHPAPTHPRVALGAMPRPPAPALQLPVGSRASLDEARIWNVGRTQAQIQATKNTEITSGTNLVARWGLDEGFRTLVGDSIAPTATARSPATGSARTSGFNAINPRWPPPIYARRHRDGSRS